MAVGDNSDLSRGHVEELAVKTSLAHERDASVAQRIMPGFDHGGLSTVPAEVVGSSRQGGDTSWKCLGEEAAMPPITVQMVWPSTQDYSC